MGSQRGSGGLPAAQRSSIVKVYTESANARSVELAKVDVADLIKRRPKPVVEKAPDSTANEAPKP